MKRRLLLTAEINANKNTCGSCRYLTGPRIPRCELFTGTLDEDGGKVLRAEECVDAEALATARKA